MSEKNEAFLSRWSRRKRVGGADPAQGERTEAKLVTPGTLETPETGETPETPETPETGETGETEDQTPPDLPDIDSLDKDSDYTVFLREGVPQKLKNLALRKLWRSDPVLANVDGLNDYDDDYTKMFTSAVTKNVKTLFRVGKGMIDSDEEAAEAAEAEARTPRKTAKKATGKATGKPAKKPVKKATGKAPGKPANKPVKKATGKAPGKPA